jgi:hypothetical protein
MLWEGEGTFQAKLLLPEASPHPARAAPAPPSPAMRERGGMRIIENVRAA